MPGLNYDHLGNVVGTICHGRKQAPKFGPFQGNAEPRRDCATFCSCQFAVRPCTVAGHRQNEAFEQTGASGEHDADHRRSYRYKTRTQDWHQAINDKEANSGEGEASMT